MEIYKRACTDYNLTSINMQFPESVSEIMSCVHDDTLLLLFDIFCPHPQLSNQTSLFLPFSFYDCYIAFLELSFFIW